MLWLGALVIGFYFTTGSGDRVTNDPVSAPAGATTSTDEPGAAASATSATTTTAPWVTVPTNSGIVATLDTGRFSLSGVVPDEESIERLLAAATIVYGQNIGANLAVSEDAETGPWLDGVERTITLLPMIGNGSISFAPEGVTVTGTAPNEQLLAAFEQAVSATQGGADVVSTVEVTDLGFPRFNARRTTDSIVFTGELASQAAKDNIVDGGLAVYGDAVDDQLTIQPGLDTPFWTFTLPGVFQLLQPFPDYEINIENGITSGSLNAGANFEIDSTELNPETQALLGVAVAILTRDPTLGMEVAGHTDSLGDSGYNQTLSERRAQAVIDFLVAAGIDSSRLRGAGYGESRPLGDNNTQQGRALNRRVEFIFGPAELVLAP